MLTFATALAALWTLVDLGTLGGPGSYGAAVSDSGYVVGCADLPGGGAHAFIWRGGVMRDLDAASAGTGSSCALAVNNLGVAAGRTVTQELVIWNASSTSRIGAAGNVSGINDAGVVVGTYKSGDATRGFMFTRRGLVDLGTFWPNAINNRNQAAGGSQGVGLLWENGVTRDIGTLGGTTNAFGINDRGVVVGVSSVNGQPTPFIYDGAMRALPGPGYSNAIAVNESGVAIGSGEGIHGFVINGDTYQRLDTLPEVAKRGWRHMDPTGINDHGWIVGTGTNENGDMRAFLLIPGRPVVARDPPVDKQATSNPAARW
jgi:probable HAF family extracellular repeat protein